MADVDETDGSEIAEALVDVYTQSQFREIWNTVKWRSNIQDKEIMRQLERAGSWYALYRQVLTEESRPSERERRLVKVRDTLCAAVKAVRNLPSADRDHLRSAGEVVAKRDGNLPDVQPKRQALFLRPEETWPRCVTTWDADRQISLSLERVEWLIGCVEMAIERTAQEKAAHGSRPADDALHTTIRALDEVYSHYAANPRTPGADIGDDTAESRTYRKSELLDFLEAALRPLGITKSREAIYADWRRAAPLPKNA